MDEQQFSTDVLKYRLERAKSSQGGAGLAFDARSRQSLYYDIVTLERLLADPKSRMSPDQLHAIRDYAINFNPLPDFDMAERGAEAMR